ncbi:MAG: hypothetical protein Edafosvirus45_3 [Edafosvirus sp.]|uniref:Uncharacterized protein n=1 Tax=Edafosvirus sp. TaxID=2487765 RepID=A0A3G4ZX31_9VIRU|nr:MAG: hypothetical protein Edafosvirus45_3 [Edafosvirus sp.]
MSFIDNEYVITILFIFLIIYASLSQVQLPNSIVNLFKNNIFRVVFLSLLLVYTFNKAPHVAIIVSLIFVLTLYYIEIQETKENFIYLETFCDQLKKYELIKKNKNKQICE